MRNGIVHHKSDRKLCVIPTADRNIKYKIEIDTHDDCQYAHDEVLYTHRIRKELSIMQSSDA